SLPLSLPIRPPLPFHLLEHLVLKPAPVKEKHEQRQPQRRNRAIRKRKIGFGDPVVKPHQVAHPQNQENPSSPQPGQRALREMRIPQLESQNRQPENEQEIQRAPYRQ